VVYVGTIVASRLVRPLTEFRSGNPHRRPMVHHDVEPQIVLKGAPQVIPEIISASGYVDPTTGRFWEIAELMPVAPGDTLLIVGHAGKPVFVGLCSASRRWDAQTGKLVRHVFPDAP
jgi:hypothetical protein